MKTKVVKNVLGTLKSATENVFTDGLTATSPARYTENRETFAVTDDKVANYTVKGYRVIDGSTTPFFTALYLGGVTDEYNAITYNGSFYYIKAKVIVREETYSGGVWSTTNNWGVKEMVVGARRSSTGTYTINTMTSIYQGGNLTFSARIEYVSSSIDITVQQPTGTTRRFVCAGIMDILEMKT